MAARSKLEKMQATDASATESVNGKAKGAASRVPPPKAPPHVARLKHATLPVMAVPVDLIEPDPDQLRKTFREADTAELAASLAAGQLQAGMGYWHAETERYRLIFGERRYRAAVAAGQPTLDLRLIEPEPDTLTIRRYQRVENMQRVAVDAIEQAHDFARAIAEDGLSLAQLAADVGCKKPKVAKILALAKLPEEVQALVSAELLSPRAAYALSTILKTHPDQIVPIARKAALEKWHADRVELAVDHLRNPPQRPAPEEEDREPERTAISPGNAPRPAPPRPGDEVWRAAPLSQLRLVDLSEKQCEALVRSPLSTLGELSDAIGPGGPGVEGFKGKGLARLRSVLTASASDLVAEAAGDPDPHAGPATRKERPPAAPDRTPAEVFTPHGPTEVAGGFSYTFNSGDGRVASLLVPGPRDAAGAALIGLLEGCLRGARIGVGPAAVLPVGTRVLVTEIDSPYYRHRGAVESIHEGGEHLRVRLDVGFYAPAVMIFRPFHLRREARR